MRRVVIYVRVSTQEQAAEGYSIGEQLERLRLFCKAHDWTLVDEYVDPGYSGATLQRPAISKLISDIEKKHSTPFWFISLTVYPVLRRIPCTLLRMCSW